MEVIPELLKNFRQAILTQAVTGKLTEEWREGKELVNMYDFVEKLSDQRKIEYEKADYFAFKKIDYKPKQFNGRS